MSLRRYAVRRTVGTVVTFFVIATILFFLFRQVGSPIGLHISDNMSPEQIEAVRASFGLDEPLYVQYYNYLVNIVTLEFGRSFYYSSPVGSIVIERLYNSLFLTIPSILIGYFVGVIGGVYLGWNRGNTQERLGLVVALVFRSTPRFWLGLVLLFVFGSVFGLFPMSGMLPPGTEFDSHLQLVTIPAFYSHIVLPIASMTLYLMGLPLLLMRTSLFEVMNEEFIEMVRAKGASESRIMYRHAARNALLPVTTAFGVAIGYSFGGNLLVETVFSYPGIGRLMVNSVFRGDFPVAQFSFLMMAGVILLMNLIVDLTYGYLDPRVTYD
jgi:peptide/nickel transport system permease protein